MWGKKDSARLKEAVSDRENFQWLLRKISKETMPEIDCIRDILGLLVSRQTDEELTSKLGCARQAGYRLAVKMEDIRDFSEIDAKQIKIENDVYCITQVLGSFFAQTGFINDAGLDIVFDLCGSIPEKLKGDSEKIIKIIRHLVTNSCRFTQSGGVYVHIGQVKRPYGINLVIEVEDTGCGMSEDELDLVYDRFFQAGAQDDGLTGGIGLGITIVGGFVAAMGGVMHIDSVKGEGTKVSVSIPQEVCSKQNCLLLKDADQLVPAGFLGFATISNPRVRDYYMRMITNLMASWSIAFPRVTSLQDLKELQRTTDITHLFVGTGEYLENKDYVDRLAGSVNVALIRDMDFDGKVDDNITIIAKPFYAEHIVEFLEKRVVSDKEVLPEDLKEASSGSEETEESGVFDIDGLDCNKGLSYCMDDLEFYCEVLWEYADGYEEKVAELKKAFSDKDWKLYGIKTHAIKSTSEMIGATELSKRARELEMAASESDEQTICKRHPDFMTDYEYMVRSISEALSRNKEKASDDKSEVFEFFPTGGETA